MTERRPILWLTEQDVVSLVPLNDAVDALERTLRQLGAGRALNVPKALAAFGDGASMHSLGSANLESGYAGFKNWVFTRNGASALFVLFDSNDGSTVAVIEAAALGQLRTSAISGLATRWLAAADADVLALLGTGSQALTQAIAVALVRPLREVRVYGRTAQKREALVSALAKELKCPVAGYDDPAAATRGASIVTIVTRAQEPFITAAMLSPGAHVNAVGAILPKNAEFDTDVFDRCSVLAVDDLSGVQKNSREFIERFAGRDWSSVRPLAELIAAGQGRPSDADLTLFKAMGMGLSDMAIAIVLMERALKREGLLAIPQPRRGTLRWQL